jgi:hypothetical protein
MIVKNFKFMLRLFFALWFLLLLIPGCAHHKNIPYEPVLSVYTAEDDSGSLLYDHAPLFLTYDFQNSYNRVGHPKAEKDKNENIKVFVDPTEPVIYAREKDFSTDKGMYKNLIYRVHFPEVPFRLIPFNLTAGKNVGLIVVITLNHDHDPVLITTVHTCGCYLAIVPTTNLAKGAFRSCWKEEPMKVYGEILPPILEFKKKANPRLLIYLRPEVHRVMNLEVVDERLVSKAKNIRLISAPLVPGNCLEKLSVNGNHVSFFYNKGLLQGHVKGSVKPWETMFLSLISLDLFVGSDKAYDDPEKTGNPFYTSLKPWNRHKSNMWYFADFLEFWGWNL